MKCPKCDVDLMGSNGPPYCPQCGFVKRSGDEILDPRPVRPEFTITGASPFYCLRGEFKGGTIELTFTCENGGDLVNGGNRTREEQEAVELECNLRGSLWGSMAEFMGTYEPRCLREIKEIMRALPKAIIKHEP